VTVARLVLSIVLFVLIALEQFPASLAVFLIAAGTDWVDGYWARKYGQITQLGRILDPFADKLIVCGTFIFLAAAPQLADGSPASGIAAWVAVLVMAREMIVTALRSMVESRGGDFSAKWVGKWKMVFQCTAAAFGIGQLMWYDGEARTLVDLPAWVAWGLAVSLWTAIVLTIWSGVGYVMSAARMLRGHD
jgi:CDP-diacylglycerol--glycerol-3-phosphate 3-phosphatidyltransferase